MEMKPETTQPHEQASDERALFEAYARKELNIPDHVEVKGRSEWLLGAWNVWQASAALTRQAAPEAPTLPTVLPDDVLRYVMECTAQNNPEGARRIRSVYHFIREALASTGAAPEAPMTYDEFIAEGIRRGFKLAAPEAPVSENGLLRDALRNIRDYRTDVSPAIAARSMRFYADQALTPEAPVSEQQALSDEEAYAQSSYRHFMSLEKFRDFRAGIVPAATTASVSELEKCGVCGNGQLYCNECGTGFASIRRAALTQQSAAQAPIRQAHPITEAELRDPEYMRHYVEECSSTLGDVLAENGRLRAAQASHAGADTEQLANRVRDLIADHVADNWPMVRRPLEEIDKKLRAINAGHLLKQSDAAMSAATEQKEKP